ncbi:MAG: hypothetical protein H3C68_07185 [Deltaproteobacteria bacterium]|nr:hypothetical protein [Deltaproteobacteria bacterium]MBZ0219461.1 hypothetical protein [Deltaproteobacteria bacterium]
MSFYTVIKTELSVRKYLICALEELKKRGEITSYVANERKDTVEVDRDGDIINIAKEKTGNYQLGGDNRVVNSFSNRLKQMYAYESIKDNLPLDFEISSETETAGEIQIVLKG